MTTHRLVARVVILSAIAWVLVGAVGAARAQTPPPAYAGSSGGGGGHGFGLGAAAMLSGPSGLTGTYDGGVWHADLILGLSNDGDDTGYGLGARGFYHLHRSTAADFGLGGGVGVTHARTGGGMNPRDVDVLHIEGGLMIRAFIAPQVALNAFAGVALLANDGDGYAISGQNLATNGGVGITYFFQ